MNLLNMFKSKDPQFTLRLEELTESYRKADPNIIGCEMELVPAWVDGCQYTDDLVIRFYVAQKKDDISQIPEGGLIPFELGGVETDVYELGAPMKLLTTPVPPVPNPHLGRMPMLMGGQSVGKGMPGDEVTAGSYAMTVIDNQTGLIMGLSNWHVLAGKYPKQGDWIYQPGPLDSRRNHMLQPGDPLPDEDKAGRLWKWVGADPNVSNRVDCATFIPTHRQWTRYENVTGSYKGFRSTRRLQINDQVMAMGRTPPHAEDLIVLGVNSSFDVDIDGVIHRFDNQVLLREQDGSSGSQGGDSGSIIVYYDAAKDEHMPGALLFAGGGGFTLANHIHNVLQALDVRITWDENHDGKPDYAGGPEQWPLAIPPQSRKGQAISGSYTVNIVDAPNEMVNIDVRTADGRNQYLVNEDFTIEVELTFASDGAPLARRAITMNGMDLTTNDQGIASVMVSMPVAGQYVAQANFGGD